MRSVKQQPSSPYGLSSRRWTTALAGLCLSLFLTSCAAPRATLRDPHLLRDCEKPALEGSAWGDVAVLAKRQQASLDECNSRWRYLRGGNT